jgi:hypothetical protein
MKFFRGVITLFSVVALFSCNAPHLNPLDPNNSDYQFSTIDGYVVTAASSNQKLTGVKVTWINQNIVTTTDANGYYKFEDVSKKEGTIVFEKEGYVKESVVVKFDNQISKSLDDVSLNAIPVLDSLYLYTIVRNKYQTDEPEIQVVVRTKVSDAEGDVDSVFVKCSLFSSLQQLGSNSGHYEKTFNESDFNLSSQLSIDAAIGQNFYIYVKDKKKGLFNVGSSSIKRIIKEEVLPESPLNKQTVGTKPTLKWYRLLPGFNFTYTVQIYTDVNTPVLVWQKQNISKDTIEIVPDTVFAAGEYYWVIWCIDDYQDQGRSKIVSFVVQ